MVVVYCERWWFNRWASTNGAEAILAGEDFVVLFLCQPKFLQSSDLVPTFLVCFPIEVFASDQRGAVRAIWWMFSPPQCGWFAQRAASIRESWRKSYVARHRLWWLTGVILHIGLVLPADLLG